MKVVKIIFENSVYNYLTDINPQCTYQEIRKYFVNSYFDVGVYPAENMQKCINVEIIN